MTNVPLGGHIKNCSRRKHLNGNAEILCTRSGSVQYSFISTFKLHYKSSHARDTHNEGNEAGQYNNPRTQKNRIVTRIGDREVLRTPYKDRRSCVPPGRYPTVESHERQLHIEEKSGYGSGLCTTLAKIALLSTLFVIY